MSGTQQVGIIELGDICAALRARSLDLFEVTGEWAIDTADPPLQRRFAEASHLHAWHADLWAARSPAIPPVDADLLVDAHREPAPLVGAEDRADRHRTWLDVLLMRLDDLEGRIDPVLDPSTRRTIALTRADLVALRRE